MSDENNRETEYPLVSPEEWAEMYKLEMLTITCRGCKNQMKLTVPVSFGNYRGFQAPEHGCAPEFNYASFVCISDEDNKKWDEIFKGVE